MVFGEALSTSRLLPPCESSEMSSLPYSEKTATKQQFTSLGVFHSAFIMSHLAMKSTPLKTSLAPNLNSTTTPPD
ncbi:hypothetical protein H5410_023045 [Solanum commersonii]|uniref:Uncharacterized protein n=1 Tax=Solanum commersonii TaxID=4109 RepID=A0A9J5ZJ25_SOLCO|nr:hypothetical protein H5410_023045 [Solanum commersonii]